MPAFLEVWKGDGPRLVGLERERLTIGKAETNDVPIAGDATVSRMHAVLECFPAGWCIRDLASHNGTFVNGQRILGERPLHAGDEIRVGRTRLVYRDDEGGSRTVTRAAEGPPALTPREADVLLALCRPVLSGDLFTEPASIRRIAEDLVVSEAAVKQHLLRLYDKFALYEGQGRRLALANEAIRRGAVSVADVRKASARES